MDGLTVAVVGGEGCVGGWCVDVTGLDGVVVVVIAGVVVSDDCRCVFLLKDRVK